MGYKDFFDIIFTSPPYFNVERYSYDETQSWVRHKEINEWNENFLQKTLKILWCSVKSGGYLLVNISDVYSNSKWSTDRGWLEICNPMNDFLSTFTDSEYQGCIGMELIKRPNSGGVFMHKSDDYTEVRSRFITMKMRLKKLKIKHFVVNLDMEKVVDYFKKFYGMKPYTFQLMKRNNGISSPHMKKMSWWMS